MTTGPPNGIGAQTLADATTTDAAKPAAPELKIGTFGKVRV